MYNNNESSNQTLIDDQTLITTIMNNKRHRSAAKSFKCPPQPKFCIRESLADGRDVFINVLAYSRIANQLSEFDPVPLYGGMQIRSSSSFKNPLHQTQQQSSQLPQLIFAVMASPEVLKKAGRNCLECPEQLNLVELMCEFVEAMNPGLILSKRPQILKDRDLTGELKDIWSAVQNFRDKEKAGVSEIVVYTEFGPESAATTSPSHSHSQTPSEISLTEHDQADETAIDDKKIMNCQSDELDSIENSTLNENINIHHEKDEMVVDNSSEVVIEKLSLIDTEEDVNEDTGSSKKLNKNSSNKLSNENESSEKLVKAQNQKNKESHNFLPKFLTSNKDKDTKEKEKSNEELDTKVKTKKGLNFFRRNKTSSTSTGSPTHAASQQQNKV